MTSARRSQANKEAERLFRTQLTMLLGRTIPEHGNFIIKDRKTIPSWVNNPCQLTVMTRPTKVTIRRRGLHSKWVTVKKFQGGGHFDAARDWIMSVEASDEL